jgi:glycogen operon protein
MTWLDWKGLDEGLIEHTAMLSAIRKRFPALTETTFLNGDGDVEWLTAAGTPMTVEDWEQPGAATFMALFKTPDVQQRRTVRLAVVVNRSHGEQPLALPLPDGREWVSLLTVGHAPNVMVGARTVEILVENY